MQADSAIVLEELDRATNLIIRETEQRGSRNNCSRSWMIDCGLRRMSEGFSFYGIHNHTRILSRYLGSYKGDSCLLIKASSSSQIDFFGLAFLPGFLLVPVVTAALERFFSFPPPRRWVLTPWRSERDAFKGR